MLPPDANDSGPAGINDRLRVVEAVLYDYLGLIHCRIACQPPCRSYNCDLRVMWVQMHPPAMGSYTLTSVNW